MAVGRAGHGGEMTMKTFAAISPQEAETLIAGSDPAIADIRDAASFASAHIKGALHVDDANVADFVNSSDKEKPLICYCYHGMSSQSAADYFFQQGFKKVYSINGGFEAWRAAHPTVST